MNEVVVSDNVTNDWSLLDEVTQKIVDAKSKIDQADIQLSNRFRSLIVQIEMFDPALAPKKSTFKSQFKTDTPKPGSKPTDARIVVDAPGIEIGYAETEPEIVKPKPEMTLKRMFQTIASLTHPDTGNGNTILFSKARNAYKAKDFDLLKTLLAEADPEALLNLKLEEYQSLVGNKRYEIALDWLSKDKRRMERAEDYYRHLLLTELNARKELFI